MKEVSLDNYNLHIDLGTVIAIKKYAIDFMLHGNVDPMTKQAIANGMNAIVSLLDDYLRQKGIKNE